MKAAQRVVEIALRQPATKASIKKVSPSGKVPALLVGARTATALVLARALARAGAEVVVADCYPSALAGWSNAVSRMPSGA